MVVPDSINEPQKCQKVLAKNLLQNARNVVIRIKNRRMMWYHLVKEICGRTDNGIDYMSERVCIDRGAGPQTDKHFRIPTG